MNEIVAMIASTIFIALGILFSVVMDKESKGGNEFTFQERVVIRACGVFSVVMGVLLAIFNL